MRQPAPLVDAWRAEERRIGRPARIGDARALLVATLVALSTACGSCGHNNGNGSAQTMVGPVLEGTWSPIEVGGAPAGASSRLAVWSGAELIVWGGAGACLPKALCATGARYDPAQNRWTAMSGAGAPGARDEHAAVWTGEALLVWGGRGCGGLTGVCGDGALYRPASDAWVAVSSTGAPAARGWVVGAWTGTEALVWGGEDVAANQVVQTGGLYDPVAGTWRSVTSTGAPSARRYHNLLWTGSAALVWGGTAAPRPTSRSVMARPMIPAATPGGPSPHRARPPPVGPRARSGPAAR